ncbi:MAG TPA: hypothetical protein ACFYD3_04570 [Candidatus Hypogeohydataceae bacterium YC41]
MEQLLELLLKLLRHPATWTVLYGSYFIFLCQVFLEGPSYNKVSVIAALLMGQIIVSCIVLNWLWKLAQASNLDEEKPSPTEVVAFLFIPFYAIYWIFIAYRKLAKHLNYLVVQKNNIPVNPIPVKWVCIGCLVAVVVYLSCAGKASLNLVVGLVEGLTYDKLLSIVFWYEAGFSGQIILVICNFYFYESAKELIGK